VGGFGELGQGDGVKGRRNGTALVDWLRHSIFTSVDQKWGKSRFGIGFAYQYW
jgi:hypothetical protein